MKEIITKLSTYNIFNYLLPGVMFAILGQYMTSYSLIQDDLFTGLFFYYFIGLLISRIGSLILEPILKSLKFVKLEPYEDYVNTSKQDPKIDILSEQRNILRTLSALPIALGFLKIYELLPLDVHTDGWGKVIVPLGLLAVFLISYRKQTKYVTKCMKVALNDKE